MEQNEGDKRIAKLLCIGLTVLFAIAFIPSLMVAGFSLYALDTPGSGFARDAKVALVIGTSMLMPLVAIVTPVFLWMSYRRRAFRRTTIVSLIVIAFTCVWLFPFTTVFFT